MIEARTKILAAHPPRSPSRLAMPFLRRLNPALISPYRKKVKRRKKPTTQTAIRWAKRIRLPGFLHLALRISRSCGFRQGALSAPLAGTVPCEEDSRLTPYTPTRIP